MNNRVPLDRHELAPIFKVYEVRAFVTEEMAEMLQRTGLFPDASPGQRLFLWSTHRIPPKRYFGLKRDEFPSQYQIEVADNESQRCAQRKALELLALDGVLMVKVSWELRKATNSRFTPGHKVGDKVAEMTSPDHRWIDGEPSPRALDIDHGRD